MKLHDLKGTITAKKILGIDASTKSYAWAIIENDKLVDFGEYTFVGKSLYERMRQAQAAAEELSSKDVDFCGIEQAVFVGNRAVTIKLAYFYGIVMGEMAGAEIPFDDVSPMAWMNLIGNKRFTKQEKFDFKKNNPDQTRNWYKDNLRLLRKQRTMDWVKKEYKVELENDNIADAIGVCYYTSKELVNG